MVIFLFLQFDGHYNGCLLLLFKLHICYLCSFVCVILLTKMNYSHFFFKKVQTMSYCILEPKLEIPELAISESQINCPLSHCLATVTFPSSHINSFSIPHFPHVFPLLNLIPTVFLSEKFCSFFLPRLVFSFIFHSTSFCTLSLLLAWNPSWWSNLQICVWLHAVL